MSFHLLWHPFVVPGQHDTLSFFLLDSEGQSVSSGTQAYVRHLLQDMRLDAEVVQWKFQPYRSIYVNSESSPKDWHDKWVYIRRAFVVTSPPAGYVFLPEKYYNMWDASFEGEASHTSYSVTTSCLPSDAVTGCLIIANFRTEVEALHAEHTIGLARNVATFCKQYNVANPIFTRFLTWFDSKNVWQLHIDLGQFAPSFFANGADYAEQAMLYCREAGGILNYHESLYDYSSLQKS